MNLISVWVIRSGFISNSGYLIWLRDPWWQKLHIVHLKQHEWTFLSFITSGMQTT